MGTNETREPTLGEIMAEIKNSKGEVIKKVEGSRILREPTLGEIMGEIEKSKNEAMKSGEGSRISIWLTVAAFGGSMAAVGLSYLGRLLTGPWDIVSSAVFIGVVGVGVMVWARHMARRRQDEFRAKWNEPPPTF